MALVVVRGVVLAGGRSRRMGTDKALVAIDGRPLVDRVAAALRDGGCTDVECQGGDRHALADLGLTWWPDRRPHAGPVAALADALVRAQGESLVVVAACDLADLDGATVQQLVAHLGDDENLPGAVAVADGHVHLVGAWRPWVGERAQQVGDRGGSYRGFVDAVGAAGVAVRPAAVRNINRSEDLA